MMNISRGPLLTPSAAKGCNIDDQYECMECLTRFKTTEKIMFNSIPHHIKERFLSQGRRDNGYE
jgi:hypothetical protein